MDYLLKLIDTSAEIGANGIKFQILLDYDWQISKKHSMYEEFKKAMFTESVWREIFSYTANKGLDIILMPSCPKSFNLIHDKNYNIKYIDIHSVAFHDSILLQKVKESNIQVILGVGGRTTKEIDEKIIYFGDQLNVLMVGYQSFPSKIENIKLEKIKLLKNKYQKVKIGYADHSSFDSDHAISSNEWAYILGAQFFEKHLTIEEGIERWDFQSAIGPTKMKTLIEKLNFIDKEVFKYSELELDTIEDSELVYRNRQKIAVATKNLKSGEILTHFDITFKMIDNTHGLSTSELLIGKSLNKDIQEDDRITLDDVL
jgi:N,N'-diacetyllegionaminate synthase